MIKRRMIRLSVLFLLASNVAACKHRDGSSTESAQVTDGPSMTSPYRDAPSASATPKGPSIHPGVTSFAPSAGSVANALGTTTAAKRPSHCLPVLTMGAAGNSIALADTVQAPVVKSSGLFSCDSPQAAAYYCADGSLRDLVGRCSDELH